MCFSNPYALSRGVRRWSSSASNATVSTLANLVLISAMIWRIARKVNPCGGGPKVVDRVGPKLSTMLRFNAVLATCQIWWRSLEYLATAIWLPDIPPTIGTCIGDGGRRATLAVPWGDTDRLAGWASHSVSSRIWVRSPVGATEVAKLDATSWTLSLQAKMFNSGSSSKLMAMSELVSAALVVMVGKVGVVMWLLINTVEVLD